MNKNKDENTEKQNLKTVNIVIEEIKEQLFSIISNGNLPASVQELIAKDFYIQVSNASNQIYQMEKIRYEESLHECDE